jgi:hypothetical protein
VTIFPQVSIKPTAFADAASINQRSVFTIENHKLIVLQFREMKSQWDINNYDIFAGASFAQEETRGCAMSNQTKQSSPLTIALIVAAGLVSGLAIARLRFKLPRPPKGG